MNARGRAKRNVWKDTKAVSPVIAVLILIIVAVVGAVAVGLLQTGIKERAEGQAEFGDVGTHELKIIGGPGVAPMMAGPVEAGGSVTSDEAPEGTFLHEFAKKHPEIKVEFLRECCGFAMYALPIEACDMGIGRRFPTDPEKAAYPELQFKVVGKAPIAVIAKEDGAFACSVNGHDRYKTDNSTLKEIFIDKNPVNVTLVNESTEGPTELNTSGFNLSNIPILPGSERVWNDTISWNGTRGTNYLINYTSGKIEATGTAGNLTNAYVYYKYCDGHVYKALDPVVYAFDPSHKTLGEWEGKGAELRPPGEVYGTSIQGMFSLYLMQGPSSTAWILGGAEDNLVLNEAIGDGTGYTLANTQEEVVEYVANHQDAVGFVDYMYAWNYIEENPGRIVILGLDGITEPNQDPEEIGTADTTNSFGGEGYVTGFGGPMFTPVMVFTYGEPDPYEQAVIDSLQMFEGVEVLTEHGFLAGENIVVSATCPFHTE